MALLYPKVPSKKLIHMQTRAESVGTGVFAPLNTVHVRYRGRFVETFKCCGKSLKEVPAQSGILAHLLCLTSSCKSGLNIQLKVPCAAVPGQTLCAWFWRDAK